MLTEEQLKAINSIKDRIFLNAGPGTGKTTVLTERVFNMVTNWNVPEERIHTFTFTNKATQEMESRLDKKFGREHNVQISNFHQYTFMYLREYYNPDIEVLLDSSKEEISNK